MQLTADRAAKASVAALEILVAAILSAAIVVAAAKMLGEVAALAEAEGFSKTDFLRVLDSALLVILAIDVVRTLLTALVRRAIPLRIVVETAILAILREFIAIEIRQPSNSFLLTLTAVFAALLAAWVVVGLYEEGIIQERLRRRSSGGGGGGGPS